MKDGKVDDYEDQLPDLIIKSKINASRIHRSIRDRRELEQKSGEESRTTRRVSF